MLSNLVSLRILLGKKNEAVFPQNKIIYTWAPVYFRYKLVKINFISLHRVKVLWGMTFEFSG